MKKGFETESAMLKSIGFWAVVKEDLRVHKREWSKPGFQTLFVHRVGVYAKTIAIPFRLPLDIIYAIGWRFCRNFYGIELRRSASLGRRVEFGHQHGIIIHEYAHIGDDCLIRHGVTFGMSNTWEVGVGPVIGNNVSFGVGTVIMGNVTIGDNVTIGPNSVVSTDVSSDRTLIAPTARILPKTK